MSDLQDIIASNTVRAFNAGYAAGRQEVLSAVKFVQVDYYDHEVVIISDLEEELADRAKLSRSDSQNPLSQLPKVPNDD